MKRRALLFGLALLVLLLGLLVWNLSLYERFQSEMEIMKEDPAVCEIRVEKYAHGGKPTLVLDREEGAALLETLSGLRFGGPSLSSGPVSPEEGAYAVLLSSPRQMVVLTLRVRDGRPQAILSDSPAIRLTGGEELYSFLSGLF